MIDIRDPSSNAPIDAAIAKLDTYDWLIFTSANGVRHFIERLDASGRDLRALRARICAIGPGTKSAIEALHIKVDRIPKEFVAESMLEALAGEDLQGKHVLLPRAAVARDVVPVELTRRGGHCGRSRGLSHRGARGSEGTRLRGPVGQTGLDHVHQFIHGYEPGYGGRCIGSGGNKVSLHWSYNIVDVAGAWSHSAPRSGPAHDRRSGRSARPGMTARARCVLSVK